MGPEHILFLCTANVDRSRAAEDLYRDDPRYEVRSAGLAPFAKRLVDRALVQWADRIFVMDEATDRHLTRLRLRFPDLDRPVVVLAVEDRWVRGDPELARQLLRALRPHLGEPRAGGA